MTTSPDKLRAQIRHHLSQVPPETWEPAELAIVLTALTIITENRREVAARPTARVLQLVPQS